MPTAVVPAYRCLVPTTVVPTSEKMKTRPRETLLSTAADACCRRRASACLSRCGILKCVLCLMLDLPDPVPNVTIRRRARLSDSLTQLEWRVPAPPPYNINIQSDPSRQLWRAEIAPIAAAD
ncbi:hypothetical protein SEVIR_1G177760v4 [Setaria viridis]